MELAFETKSLRDICESETQAKREFPLPIVESLKRRLGDMRAAIAVVDLPAGQPHGLVISGLECMAVNLNDGYRVIFCANHTKKPITENGVVDWARVNRIKILRIEKHDGE